MEPEPVDPNSLTARLSADWRLILLSPGALLMQAAHPVIGGALVDHSIYAIDPWGRFDRSWWPTLALAFYGERSAEYGRNIRAMHRPMGGTDHRGRTYHAWDPEAYFFVIATGFHAAEQLADVFDRPLTQRRREELYAGFRQVALLAGSRERDVPADLTAFRQFFDRVVNERLENSPSARTFLGLFDGRTVAGPPRVPEIVWRPIARFLAEPVIRLIMIGTTPPVLRERLGLEWTASDERKLRRIARAIKAVDKVLPPSIRTITRTVALRRQDEIMATIAENARAASRPISSQRGDSTPSRTPTPTR